MWKTAKIEKRRIVLWLINKEIWEAEQLEQTNARTNEHNFIGKNFYDGQRTTTLRRDYSNEWWWFLYKNKNKKKTNQTSKPNYLKWGTKCTRKARKRERKRQKICEFYWLKSHTRLTQDNKNLLCVVVVVVFFKFNKNCFFFSIIFSIFALEMRPSFIHYIHKLMKKIFKKMMTNTRGAFW